MSDSYGTPTSMTKKRPFYLLGRRAGCQEMGLSAKGFTLTEMLVVIAIVGIISGLAIASFAGQKRKYDVDNQLRRMYADLSNVKMMAMTRGRTHFVTLTANGYTAYDDTDPAPDGNDTLAVGSDAVALKSDQSLNLSTVTKQQFLPIAWGNGAQINFNSRGLCTTATPTQIQTVCVYSNITPRYDCINISPTRIALGKLAAQGVCSAANCRIQ